jgi:hypothetical protein
MRDSDRAIATERLDGHSESHQSPSARCGGADDVYADLEFGFVDLVLSCAELNWTLVIPSFA